MLRDNPILFFISHLEFTNHAIVILCSHKVCEDIMKHIPFFKLQRQYNRIGVPFFTQLRNEYGDVVATRVPILGQQYWLFHPYDVYQALIKHDDQFKKSSFIQSRTRSSFGNGLLMSEGDVWKKHRRLMQPHFHHVYVTGYGERMVHHAQRLAQQWEQVDTINIDAEMHALAFNIIVDVLFSADASDSTDEISVAMHDLGAGLEAQGRSLLIALMPDWMPVPILQRKRRGERLLHEMVQAMISSRREQGQANAPQDLLSMLVFSHDEDTGETMSDSQIHDELVTMYIAGHETTALLMGWTWAMLSKHPDVEAKLHEELDTVLGGNTPTVEGLSQLTYTNWVIKETLRLYPPAWFFLRETTDTVILRNNTLEAEKICVFVSYATHRDERYFENANEFIPERWADDFEKTLPKGAYFPFGMGKRTCIGNGVALLEAQLVLATLAQQYRLELLDEPQVTKNGLTLAFRHPVKMRVIKR